MGHTNQLHQNVISCLILIIMLVFSCMSSTSMAAAAPPNYHIVVMKNETDRLSLLAFKKEVTLDPNNVLNSWNNSLHFCSWHGVTCGRKHQRVTALKLYSSGLEGTLTPYLGNLSFLRRLYLLNNSFHGEIPQELGRLFRLEYLWLFNNSLDGNIPTNLSNCSHLINLDLGNNKLEGGIPIELGSLPRLAWLSLQRNYPLGGAIPHSLGNLTSLTYLGLSHCGLQGTIPHQLRQLSKLLYLVLTANDLQGEIPSLLFSNMSSLVTFSAGDNNLSGNLPLHVGASFQDLKIFNVANNQMKGYLPHSIWNLTQLSTVNVGGNSFLVSIPLKIGGLASLRFLDVEHNQLGGSLANDLQFITSLINCTQLIWLLADENNFQGLLPSSITNLSSNLQLLYLGENPIYGTIHPEVRKLISLQELGLHDCHLMGRIPDTIGELSNLQLLILDHNMLTGPIPVTLGNLSALFQVFLTKNQLRGYIPPTLGNCTNLDQLYLSFNGLKGPIPPALGRCTKLRMLDLSNNGITGIIPIGLLMSLTSLLTLDLGYNMLTGPLPAEVGKLININVLNVSSNRLSGAIPESLGSCLTLEFLFLDNNAFEGNIPASLKDLKALQQVDLSRNKLAGHIPGYFTEMKSLKYLNLSFNNLEGDIPIEGVFKDLSAISLQGNTKLCGGIPQLHFQPCTKKKSDGNNRAKYVNVFLPALLGSIAFIIIVWAIFMVRKKKLQEKCLSKEHLEDFKMKMVSYRDILNATNNLSSSNLIGSGSFGLVYRGVFEAEKNVVAVKVFDLEKIGASKSFIAECVALQNIRHRNLVKFLTCCSGYDFKDHEFKALVYEFMENGTLESWLHPAAETSSSQSRYLSLRGRLEIAIDVAHALDYLHNQCHTPIVHCDLKPSNILLDEGMVAHVGDFGLAKLLKTTNVDSSSQLSSAGKLKGTMGYIPPEYGTSSNVTKRGDIFSYGIILLEMLIGKKPTHEMFKNDLTISTYAKRAYPDQVMKIVDQHLLPINLEQDMQSQVCECVASIIQVGIECSSENPSDRIDMGTVKRKLELQRKALPRDGST